MQVITAAAPNVVEAVDRYLPTCLAALYLYDLQFASPVLICVCENVSVSACEC